jgi:hypothetical protein
MHGATEEEGPGGWQRLGAAEVGTDRANRGGGAGGIQSVSHCRNADPGRADEQ